MHTSEYRVLSVYAKSGYRAALRRIVELNLQLAKKRHVDPGDTAMDYAALGQKDQALSGSRKRTLKSQTAFPASRQTPDADRLRSDPRYAALQKEMGLPR